MGAMVDRLGWEVAALQAFPYRGTGTPLSQIFLDGDSLSALPGCLPVSVLSRCLWVWGPSHGCVPLHLHLVRGKCLSGPSVSLGWFEMTPDWPCCPGWSASPKQDRAELRLIQVGPESSEVVFTCPPSHLALVGWQLEGSRSPCLWSPQPFCVCSHPKAPSKSSICPLLLPSFLSFRPMVSDSRFILGPESCGAGSAKFNGAGHRLQYQTAGVHIFYLSDFLGEITSAPQFPHL